MMFISVYRSIYIIFNYLGFSLVFKRGFINKSINLLVFDLPHFLLTLFNCCFFIPLAGMFAYKRQILATFSLMIVYIGIYLSLQNDDADNSCNINLDEGIFFRLDSLSILQFLFHFC